MAPYVALSTWNEMPRNGGRMAVPTNKIRIASSATGELQLIYSKIDKQAEPFVLLLLLLLTGELKYSRIGLLAKGQTAVRTSELELGCRCLPKHCWLVDCRLPARRGAVVTGRLFPSWLLDSRFSMLLRTPQSFVGTYERNR